MKIKFILSVIFCITIVGLFSLQAQETGLDSVYISKPKKGKFLYEFRDPLISTITIKDKKPKRSPVSSGEVLGNAGRTALALFAGELFTFGSSTDVFWNVRGDLTCNNEVMNWEISLFCPGVLEKEKHRVANDDGSFSVETEKTAFLDWDREATGVIIELGDTIGRFIIIMDPRTNALVKEWNEAPFRKRQPRYQIPKRNFLALPDVEHWYADYGIVGKLRGQSFVLLYNAELWQTWLFDENRLRMIFDADIDDFPMTTKKDKLAPSLKLNMPIKDGEQRDLFRMAMLSRFLAKNLNQRVVEM